MFIVLPKQPDEEILKLIIKAKCFLEHAKQHINLNGDFDIMIAIHNLDNAIEYILRIMIRHFEIEETLGITINTCELSQLIGHIRKFLAENTDKSLPLIQEIKMIRELRNMVQHGMVLPTKEVDACFSHGEKFFNRTLERFFGISVESVNYSTIIKLSAAKELLQQAEEKITTGDYLEAIVAVRDAFDYAGFIYNRTGRTRIRRAPVLAELKEKSENLFYYLQEIDEQINISSSNIDAQKYKRYSDYINCIPHEHWAEWHSNTVLERPWNKIDAEYCYAFVANAIIQWELSEYQPIQEHRMTLVEKPVKFVEKINGVEIVSAFSKYNCIYVYNSMSAHLFYCDESVIEQLRVYLDNPIVEASTERYSGDKKDVHRTSIYSINSYNISLVMNNPPTWEIIIIYNEIPFTSVDVLNQSEINIDEVTKKTLQDNDIDKKLMDIIIHFFEKHGPLSSMRKALELKMKFSESGYEDMISDFYSQNFINKFKKRSWERN